MADVSSSEIDGGDLDALMAQFPADLLAGLGIDKALSRCHGVSAGTTCGRRFPAGQRLVAGLCIGMAQPMHVAQAGRLALTIIDMALLDIAPVLRDQRAGAGKGMSLSENGRCSAVVIGTVRSRPPLVHDPLSAI